MPLAHSYFNNLKLKRGQYVRRINYNMKIIKFTFLRNYAMCIFHIRNLKSKQFILLLFMQIHKLIHLPNHYWTLQNGITTINHLFLLQFKSYSNQVGNKQRKLWKQYLFPIKFGAAVSYNSFYTQVVDNGRH